MTQAAGQAGLQGMLGAVRTAAAKNPATQKLLHEVEEFLGAQVQQLVGNAGSKVGQLTRQLTDVAEGGGGMLGQRARSVMQGESPVKAVTKAGFKGVGDKVRSALPGGKKEGGGGAGPSGGGKFTNIIEDINIGMPLREVYDQWTKFTEFPKWSKGAQRVEQKDERPQTNWNAKILFSTRTWNATVIEMVPDDHISWKSEGANGTVHGVVSFHPLGEKLTKVLVTLQYYPQGFVEKTANLWRAQGRRVRLDLKLFRRYVMMGESDPEGVWRGEIRDGEVVREHDEVVQEEERQKRGEGREDGAGEEEQPEEDDEDDDYDEDEEYEDVDYEEEEEAEPPRRSRQRTG
jgi:uncharacterized membrane protein